MSSSLTGIKLDIGLTISTDPCKICFDRLNDNELHISYIASHQDTGADDKHAIHVDCLEKDLLMRKFWNMDHPDSNQKKYECCSDRRQILTINSSDKNIPDEISKRIQSIWSFIDNSILMLPQDLDIAKIAEESNFSQELLAFTIHFYLQPENQHFILDSRYRDILRILPYNGFYNRLSLEVYNKIQQNCQLIYQGLFPCLYLIPDCFKTQELCSYAVATDGHALEHVPNPWKTEELCMKAFNNCHAALKYFPHEILQNKKLLLDLMTLSGDALDYVPDDLRDEEVCLTALQHGAILGYVPEKLRTEKLCREAIKRNGHNLYAVPPHLITEEMCWEAIQQCGWALMNVPEKFKTAPLCWAAIRLSGLALSSVPKHLIDEKMCWEAVENCGAAIAGVPEQFLSEEICLRAVDHKYNGGQILQYVPEKFRTEKICQKALLSLFKPRFYWIPKQIRHNINGYTEGMIRGTSAHLDCY
jgi:hypothetical protein